MASAVETESQGDLDEMKWNCLGHVIVSAVLVLITLLLILLIFLPAGKSGLTIH